MTIKSTVYGDVTPCSLIDGNETFRRNILPSSTGQKLTYVSLTTEQANLSIV